MENSYPPRSLLYGSLVGFVVPIVAYISYLSVLVIFIVLFTAFSFTIVSSFLVIFSSIFVTFLGLFLCSVLVVGYLVGCKKPYNLNEYTEIQTIHPKINSNGKVTKPLFNRIKEGSIIEYEGVVSSSEIGYDEKGNEVYFYRIQPICKGSNLKYASESYGGLMVLSPLREVNRDILNFHDYLERGDIVNIKGRKVENGEYYTSKLLVGKNEECYKWDYIEAEQIEFIGHVDE